MGRTRRKVGTNDEWKVGEGRWGGIVQTGRQPSSRRVCPARPCAHLSTGETPGTLPVCVLPVPWSWSAAVAASGFVTRRYHPDIPFTNWALIPHGALGVPNKPPVALGNAKHRPAPGHSGSLSSTDPWDAQPNGLVGRRPKNTLPGASELCAVRPHQRGAVSVPAQACDGRPHSKSPPHPRAFLLLSRRKIGRRGPVGCGARFT